MHTPAIAAAAAAMVSVAAAGSSKPVFHNLKQRSTPARVGAAGVVANRTGSALDASGTVTSYNWGGVVASPPDGQYFTEIVGTYTQPSCSNPNDGTTGPWSTTSWIGIDGADGAPSLIQAGSTCTANTDGSVSNYAWVEWLPEAEQPIDGFTVNTGDEFTISIVVDSPSTGSITLQAAGGPVFSTSVSAPTPSATIVGTTAEWIVEDAEAGGFVPFANFDTYNWGGAYAVTNNGGGQVAALDLTYDVWNLQLDVDGSNKDGQQVTFFGTVDDPYNDAFTVSNTGS